jgi:glyoxylase-like metal-dependent hydrolase (beta-lactamase superfamily II)
MSLNSIRTCDDLYYVDTGMFGQDERMAAYLFDGEEPAVVDPGLSSATDRVLDAFEELGVGPHDVEHIVLTHLHLDHAGAAGFLAERCPAATVHCHEIGEHFMSDEAKLENLLASVRRNVGTLESEYGTATTIPAERCDPLVGRERVDLGDRLLEVVPTPGHAPHHLCYYSSADQVLFTGDECGEYLDEVLIPTTPPPNFHLDRNLESLDRLARFEPETLLYSHYGPRYDVDGAFEEYERVLREWIADVERRWRVHLDEERVARQFVESRDAPNFRRWNGEAASQLTRMDVEGALDYLKEQRVSTGNFMR